MPVEPPAARDPGRRQALTTRPVRHRVAVGAVGAALAVGAVLAGCGGSDDGASVQVPVTSPAGADPGSATASTASDTDIDIDIDVDVTGVPDSTGASAGTDAPAGVEPAGFSTITAVITSADGEVCEVCLWLADTSDERSRGLMGVTDLGEAAGMAFRFDRPTQGAFYMFQTPTPLSIAWFADDGAWVGAEEMAPCLDTPAGECPLYSPGASYVVAVEAFAGGLDTLGVGPGSHIELVAGSEADECILAGT